MTVLVPIEVDQPPGGRPAPTPTPIGASRFASPPEPGDEVPDLEDVVRRVRGARRIVVVCGAGVSTAAAIPDFRSARGLFSGAKGHAVKDLFHVKSLSSHTLLPDHHALLTNLCERSSSAEPTPFHKLLAAIDSDGRLLRCYTQNIDGLEERAGLRTGIPPHRKRARRKDRAGAAEDASANASAAASIAASATESAANTPTESGTPAADATMPTSSTPVEHPPAPRCIPLHGLLRDMHCSLCATSVPISDFLPLPAEPIPCPQCHQESTIRSALSERQRRVGTLRASVVLYGEEHPEGELIGSVVERDLKGTGRRGEREGRADLLIVAGTSLAIPGVKRIVKEMAKVLSARSAQSVRDGKAPPIRTIFLNAEPPSKPGEWDGVFDVWAQGDIQKFAELVADESFALPPEPKKETPRSTPRKKNPAGMPPTPDTTPTKKRARAVSTLDSDEDITPVKKRAKLPLTPRPTPPRPRERGSAKKGKAKRDETEEEDEADGKEEEKETEEEKAQKRKPARRTARRARPPSPSPVVKDETVEEKPKPARRAARRPRPPSPSPAAKEELKRKTPARSRVKKDRGDANTYVVDEPAQEETETKPSRTRVKQERSDANPYLVDEPAKSPVNPRSMRNRDDNSPYVVDEPAKSPAKSRAKRIWDDENPYIVDDIQAKRVRVKKELHDDNPYLVNSYERHETRAFVDVPPLPGHHAEWGRYSPPPTYSHRPLTLTYTTAHTHTHKASFVPPLPLPIPIPLPTMSSFRGTFEAAVANSHFTVSPTRARARFSPPPPIGI